MPWGGTGKVCQSSGSAFCHVPLQGSTPGLTQPPLCALLVGQALNSSCSYQTAGRRGAACWLCLVRSVGDWQAPRNKVMKKFCTCYLIGFLLSGSSHVVYVKMLACACLRPLSFIPPKESQDVHFSVNATPKPGCYFLKKFTANKLKLMHVTAIYAEGSTRSSQKTSNSQRN